MLVLLMGSGFVRKRANIISLFYDSGIIFELVLRLSMKRSGNVEKLRYML